MDSQQLQHFLVPHHAQPRPGMFPVPDPKQPLWVPYPGSKRKAPQDLRDDELEPGFGPAPPKQMAIDEEVVDTVLKDGFIILSDDEEEGKDVNASDTNNAMLEDEEMVEVTSVIPSTEAFAGVEQTLNTDMIGGSSDKMHATNLQFSAKNYSRTDNIGVNESPKLYFFEGLKLLLEKPPDDSSILPKALMDQTAKTSSMAMMVWKPPQLCSSEAIHKILLPDNDNSMMSEEEEDVEG